MIRFWTILSLMIVFFCSCSNKESKKEVEQLENPIERFEEDMDDMGINYVECNGEENTYIVDMSADDMIRYVYDRNVLVVTTHYDSGTFIENRENVYCIVPYDNGKKTLFSIKPSKHNGSEN